MISPPTIPRVRPTVLLPPGHSGRPILAKKYQAVSTDPRTKVTTTQGMWSLRNSRSSSTSRSSSDPIQLGTGTTFASSQPNTGKEALTPPVLPVAPTYWNNFRFVGTNYYSTTKASSSTRICSKSTALHNFLAIGLILRRVQFCEILLL